MESYQVYEDIQARTGGEIYLGVVGPVRTGKSTFIKRFMEQMVLPSMEDENARQVARDELPQSSNGKTIMTTEPKFVPREAAVIHPAPSASVKVRLIDCVGFLVPGAAGSEEDGKERMVHTPWFDHEIPFSRAAQIGTEKVIREHSTVGILVTVDGSFGELPREAYLKAEEETVRACREVGKPFLILVNSAYPQEPGARKLAEELSARYGAAALPVNCETLTPEEINRILEALLMEFPVESLHFRIPRWMELLPASHPLKSRLIDTIREKLAGISKMRDIAADGEWMTEETETCRREKTDLAHGSVSWRVEMKESAYFEVLSECAGTPVVSQAQLIGMLREYAEQREEMLRIRDALAQVRASGYGVVIPEQAEIELAEPEIVRRGGRYGVRMLANAPSIHLIQAVIQTEIAPIVGSEQQAQDLVDYIQSQKMRSEDGIWGTNIFGKSIGQIVQEGIQVKTSGMSGDTQAKLQGALQKIVNSGSRNMICIIL